MNVRTYGGNDRVFLAACELAKAKVTYRQWRKWSQGRGLAHAYRQRAEQKVASEAG